MKRGLYLKSGYFVVLLCFFLVLLFSFGELSVISSYNKEIEGIYKNSIDYASNFWADRFFVANTELHSLINKNKNTDFNLICDARKEEDTSYYEKSLQLDLTNMSLLNENQMVFFAFIPERDILLSSITRIDYHNTKEIKELKEWLLTECDTENTAYWVSIEIGDTDYFIHTYCCNDAYSGCYISCSKIVADVMPKSKGSNAYISNMDGSVFYGEKSEEIKSIFSYSRAIRMINKKICIEIPYFDFVNGGSYLLIILIIAGLTAAILILVISIYQNNTITVPLKKVQDAMICFSNGETSIRLPSKAPNPEISRLYESFNKMSSEISSLKINVYEAKLENERMYNQFLRVQVHPHFYTNVLNLIHALADSHDYDTIQQLSRSMAGYFRYLLSVKGDYVRLSSEINCVRMYTNVQEIRYQGNFTLGISVNVDPEKVLVPPLVIQTFVENSIKHNIMLVEGLEIEVSISIVAGMLMININDNGRGFDSDILKRINQGEDIEDNGSHIGIYNVKQRLDYLYHGNSRIEITNEEIGADVKIWLPTFLLNEKIETEGGKS